MKIESMAKKRYLRLLNIVTKEILKLYSYNEKSY